MGESEEWATWSDTCLSKAKHFESKDILLGKLSITKSDDFFEVYLREGKQKFKIALLNEIDCSELILLIASGATIALNLVKGCKNCD